MGAPQAFPLAWPTGRPRMPAIQRKPGAFKRKGSRGWMVAVTVAVALERLDAEITALGGRYALLSSNMETRLDGRPRSGQSEPTDPGVCVYFQMAGKPYALACDTYSSVAQNIAALAAHIEATRAITRHGVASAAETLRAFEALPAPPTCWELLGLSPGATKDEVERAFRAKSKEAHPDRPGGSHDRMAALTNARAQAVEPTP